MTELDITLRDGRTLHVYDEGDKDGNVVIVHHGTPGSGLSYPPDVELARERGLRLIAYDRAGYGGSTPNPGSVRLHETMGFRSIGVHKDIGFKLGSWRDIGYWRLGLADSAAPPSEPIPFAAFQRTPAFAQVLARVGELSLASWALAER